MTVTERLRQEIKDSRVSRYRIAQQTGISEAALSRFAAGISTLGGNSIDVLASFFGLELAERRRTNRARGNK